MGTAAPAGHHPDSAHGNESRFGHLWRLRGSPRSRATNAVASTCATTQRARHRRGGHHADQPRTPSGCSKRTSPRSPRRSHEVGGLLYYDGANLNCHLGVVRPGDMELRHRPHEPAQDLRHPPRRRWTRRLAPWPSRSAWSTSCPGPSPPGWTTRAAIAFGWITRHARSVASTAGNGNALVLARALTYIEVHGADGLRRVAERARAQRELDPSPAGRVLRCRLRPARACTRWSSRASALRKDEGIKALDAGQAPLGGGLSFTNGVLPLIVDEALMIEPTETRAPRRSRRWPTPSSASWPRPAAGTIPPPRRRARRRCGASTRPGRPAPSCPLRRPRGLSPPAGSVPQRGRRDS